MLDIPDFNNDGLADLVVGVPGESIGSIINAGGVNVIYGSNPTGLSAVNNQFWSQNSSGILDLAESQDKFGAALTWADFNSDGYDDLAIGVPGEDIDGITNAGGVNVIYGSASGLTSAGNQFWSQNSSGIEDQAEANDFFGSTLTVGDFNGDGYEDLGVGVPDEDIGNTIDAGAVSIIYGSASGLTATGDQFWSQNSSAIEGTSGANDRFGEVLAAGDFNGDGRDELAVGVPGENSSAGYVNVIYGSVNGLTSTGDQGWSQNSSGIEDSSEGNDLFGKALAVGDFNNDGREDLAVGVPGEDIGTITNAGAVNVIYGSISGLSSAGDQFWSQDSSGIVDTAEANDYFGEALAVGDFNNDGRDDLVVGVAEEDIANITNAGAVNVIYGSASALTSTGNQFWSQNSSSILDSSEANDYFGKTLAVGDFNNNGRDDLAVGVVGEDIGTITNAGGVNVIYSLTTGLNSNGNQFWSQNSSGILDTSEGNDGFGRLR